MSQNFGDPNVAFPFAVKSGFPRNTSACRHETRLGTFGGPVKFIVAVGVPLASTKPGAPIKTLKLQAFLELHRKKPRREQVGGTRSSTVFCANYGQ